VFFAPSEQRRGREYLRRFRLRTEDRDPNVSEKVAPAQIGALSKWGAPRDNPYAYLKAIRQPTLVVNGGSDVIVYTVNSFILQQHIPNAQLILYPDANHGSQYQYPGLFVRHVLDVPGGNGISDEGPALGQRASWFRRALSPTSSGPAPPRP
jgi:pimeloyl-ACP methyl ester carboxylesterase